MPPQALGDDDPAGWQKHRPSLAPRRVPVRACLGGAILAAALLAGLNTYVFSAFWRELSHPSNAWFVLATEWVVVILVLNATGVVAALLAGIAVARGIVKGTRFFAIGCVAGPWIVAGLLASTTLLLLSIEMPWLVF